jgi:hypothetical protein
MNVHTFTAAALAALLLTGCDKVEYAAMRARDKVSDALNTTVEEQMALCSRKTGVSPIALKDPDPRFDACMTQAGFTPSRGRDYMGYDSTQWFRLRK